MRILFYICIQIFIFLALGLGFFFGIFYIVTGGNPFLDIFAKKYGDNYCYVKLGNKIYYRGANYEYLNKADVDSFDVIYNSANQYSGRDCWAKDKNYVYYEGRTQPYDVSSFERIDGYEKDKNGIYLQGKLVSKDIENFQSLLFQRKFPRGTTIISNISKDSAHVYIGGSILVDANPTTFQVLNTTWSTDGTNIYASGEKIYGLSPINLQIICDNEDICESYIKNDTSVYYYGSNVRHGLVVGADPNTFIVYYTKDENGGIKLIAKDKNNYYNGYEILK